MTEAIVLKDRLDLAAAPRLQASLQEAPEGDVTLDLAGVSHLGALCLQLLIAAGRRAHAKGGALHLRNTSDRVLDQMRVMGITPEMLTEGMQ